MLHQNSSRPRYLKEQSSCRWCPIWSNWDTSPLRKIIQDSLGRTASRKQKHHQMFGSAKKMCFLFCFFGFSMFWPKVPKNIEPPPPNKKKMTDPMDGQASMGSVIFFFCYFCFFDVLAQSAKDFEKPKKTKEPK